MTGRKPPPPHEFVDALQDRPYPASGRLLAATPIRTKPVVHWYWGGAFHMTYIARQIVFLTYCGKRDPHDGDRETADIAELTCKRCRARLDRDHRATGAWSDIIPEGWTP